MCELKSWIYDDLCYVFEYLNIYLTLMVQITYNKTWGDEKLNYNFIAHLTYYEIQILDALNLHKSIKLKYALMVKMLVSRETCLISVFQKVLIVTKL